MQDQYNLLSLSQMDVFADLVTLRLFLRIFLIFHYVSYGKDTGKNNPEGVWIIKSTEATSTNYPAAARGHLQALFSTA